MTLEWIVYCTECGELQRAPNGAMMEGLARLHKKEKPSHVVLLATEISGKEEKP